MRTLLAILLASALALPARAANVQVQVRDFTSGQVNNRVCTVTLVKPSGSAVSGSWVIAGDSVSLRTDQTGSCVFSNVLTLGDYRLDIAGNPGRSFPFNMTAASTNGTYNVVSLLGTNNAAPAFYDTAQVDALVGNAGTIKAITSQDGTVIITTNGSTRDLSAVGGGGSTNGFTGTQVTNAAAYQAQLSTNGLGSAAFHPASDFYGSGNSAGYQTAGQVSSSIVSAQPIMTNAALTITTALSTNFALLNAGTNQFSGTLQIKTTNQAPVSIQDATGKEFFHMALTPGFQGLGTFYQTYLAFENTPASIDPQLRIYDDPGAGNQGVILAYNSTNATFKHHLNIGASGEIYLDPLNGDAIRALSRIEPYTPGAYSIGSTSAHWLDAYFDNVFSTNFTGNAARLTNYPVATATTSGAEPPPGGNNLFRVSDAGGNPIWSSYSPGAPTWDTVGGGTNAGVSQGVGAGSILQPASSGQIIATFAQSVNASTVQGGAGNRLAQSTLATNTPSTDGAVAVATGASMKFTTNLFSQTTVTNPIFDVTSGPGAVFRVAGGPKYGFDSYSGTLRETNNVFNDFVRWNSGLQIGLLSDPNRNAVELGSDGNVNVNFGGQFSGSGAGLTNLGIAAGARALVAGTATTNLTSVTNFYIQDIGTGKETAFKENADGTMTVTGDGDTFWTIGLHVASGLTADSLIGTNGVIAWWGSLFSGNGSGVTNLNATALSSGTVPTTRLGSGVADATTFLSGDQTWKVPSGGGGWPGTNGIVGYGSLARSNWFAIVPDGWFWTNLNGTYIIHTNDVTVFSGKINLAELDVVNTYITNLFTLKTNVSFLGTDANGQLVTNFNGGALTNVTARYLEGTVLNGSNALILDPRGAILVGYDDNVAQLYFKYAPVFLDTLLTNASGQTIAQAITGATNGTVNAAGTATTSLSTSQTALTNGALYSASSISLATNAAPIWAPVVDFRNQSMHFAAATNFSVGIANFPTNTEAFAQITLSNSAASGTVLVTLIGFSAFTNGSTVATSTFYLTNNNTKRQVTKLVVDGDASGGLTNGLVQHVYDK